MGGRKKVFRHLFLKGPNRAKFRGPKQGSTGKTSQDKPNTNQGQHVKSDGL